VLTTRRYEEKGYPNARLALVVRYIRRKKRFAKDPREAPNRNLQQKRADWDCCGKGWRIERNDTVERFVYLMTDRASHRGRGDARQGVPHLPRERLKREQGGSGHTIARGEEGFFSESKRSSKGGFYNHDGMWFLWCLR